MEKTGSGKQVLEEEAKPQRSTHRLLQVCICLNFCLVFIHSRKRERRKEKHGLLCLRKEMNKFKNYLPLLFVPFLI